MANNYNPVTLSPFLKRGQLSDFALDYLALFGLESSVGEGEVYLYSEIGFSDEAMEEPSLKDVEAGLGEGCPVAALVAEAVDKGKLLPDAWGALHAIAKAHGIPEIVAEGAFYCDKMRQGEFGGYVFRVTPEGVQAGCTGDILRLMREGGWS
jgi:hypothetical protein